MAALSRQLLRSETDWVPIDDATAAGAARRAAIRLAGRLGFSEGRTGDVGIVTTEMSSNLFRHADRGVIAIQVAMRAGLPDQLQGALAELAHRVVVGRLKALEEKSRSNRLEPEELVEFQRLMSLLAPRDARGG